MSGVAFHGDTPFDVPFITKVGHKLWQGGCEEGLKLPKHIKHLVSLYPWERYTIHHEMKSELYVQMYDSVDQAFDQVDMLAQWINLCRETGEVLVHCQAGLNRSSLLAARALWLSDEGGGWSSGAYVDHLRRTRSPAALCNPSFEAEVRSWK